MIKKIDYKGHVKDIKSLKFNIETSNNFFGALSNQYIPQTLEVKKLSIDVPDFETWKVLYILFLKQTYGLSVSMAKVLFGVLELASTDRLFRNNEVVHAYLGKRLGICRMCVSNQVYMMVKEGILIEQIKQKSIYRISDKFYMPLKDSNKKLVIDISYKKEEDDN